MNWDRVLYPLDLVGCNLFGRCFVGAFSVKDVLNVGKDLKDQGFGITYNLLGEHVRDPNLVNEAVRSTLSLIWGMSPGNSGNVSCKPTLYGLSISKELFSQNIQKVINSALRRGIEVEFDAENYAHIGDTFDVFNSFASRKVYSDTVRQAVQAHLMGIISLMKKYDLFDKNIRIVKGAGVYTENDNRAVVNDGKKIEQKYLEILRSNIAAGRTPFAATVRDKRLAESVIKVAGGHTFEFQMLYGPLGRKLGKHLLGLGYPVRIYIPFTDTWCRNEWRAYGLRRAKMMRNLIFISIIAK